MLEQFLLDRLADEPNPEPTKPIPWPEEHAPVPVSADASAQGPEASPELILTTGTDDGLRATTSSGTSSLSVTRSSTACNDSRLSRSRSSVSSCPRRPPCRHVGRHLNHRFTPEGSAGDTNDTNRYPNSY
jgi:hypothetical protein